MQWYYKLLQAKQKHLRGSGNFFLNLGNFAFQREGEVPLRGRERVRDVQQMQGSQSFSNQQLPNNTTSYELFRETPFGQPVIVVHAFTLGILEAEAGGAPGFETNLLHISSSRPVNTT